MERKTISLVSKCLTASAIVLAIILVGMMAGCNEPANEKFKVEQLCLEYSNADEDNVRIVQVTDNDKPIDIAKTIEWMKADGFNLTKDYQVMFANSGAFRTYLIFEREEYQ